MCQIYIAKSICLYTTHEKGCSEWSHYATGVCLLTNWKPKNIYSKNYVELGFLFLLFYFVKPVIYVNDRGGEA